MIYGTQGIEQKWRMQRNRLSQRFTTQWDELLTVGYCHAELVVQARSLGKLPSLPIPTTSEPGQEREITA